MLTTQDYRILLDALEKQYGFGYSKIPEVGQLQAKLSIQLEATERRERAAKAAGGER